MHNSLQIPLTIFLARAIFVYVRGSLPLQNSFRQTITPGRMAAFICGILGIWIALASPLALLDHELLTVHMVQHLLLMAVGPPLILMGRPSLSRLLGMPKRIVKGYLEPLFHLPLVRELGDMIGNPVFCWVFASLTVIAWHVPAVFALGSHSPLWHEVQHLSFLLAGFLFWLPVMQPSPNVSQPAKWSVPLYLFLATLPCDALSAFLTFCGRVVYPCYLGASHPFGISALEDQEWAGVLMWVCVTFIYMIPALTLTVRILSPTLSRNPQTIGGRLAGARSR